MEPSLGQEAFSVYDKDSGRNCHYISRHVLIGFMALWKKRCYNSDVRASPKLLTFKTPSIASIWNESNSSLYIKKWQDSSVSHSFTVPLIRMIPKKRQLSDQL